AIAFTKGMNRVQFSQEMRCFAREGGRVQILQITGNLQFVEQLGRLAFDVLGEAEWVAALEQPDSSNLSRPFVDVLKKMMVDRLVVCEIQSPARQRLFCAGAGNFRLEGI